MITVYMHYLSDLRTAIELATYDISRKNETEADLTELEWILDKHLLLVFTARIIHRRTAKRPVLGISVLKVTSYNKRLVHIEGRPFW